MGDIPDPKGYYRRIPAIWDLAVGQSYVVPDGISKQTIYNAVQYCKRHTGRSFTTRKTANGYMIWRAS